ncbi:hypothetical protein DFH05DRAFT_1521246 [Lentinula detonsa]|uniref:Uncharacterized protein n=1 Tax=Lentinula detonsa TaxID=2804962 RepID=A0A9W8P9G6_9AGAR|nr:hypothetical protein DFH05DRAFT_1521246 [Lentinula detonsa]
MRFASAYLGLIGLLSVARAMPMNGQQPSLVSRASHTYIYTDVKFLKEPPRTMRNPPSTGVDDAVVSVSEEAKDILKSFLSRHADDDHVYQVALVNDYPFNQLGDIIYYSAKRRFLIDHKFPDVSEQPVGTFAFPIGILHDVPGAPYWPSSYSIDSVMLILHIFGNTGYLLDCILLEVFERVRTDLTANRAESLLSSFSSAVSTGISNSVNESTTGRGLKRSGSPLDKSGPSKLRQVGKNSAHLFRSTPETFTEIPGISDNSSPVSSPIPLTTHAQGVSTIDSSDVNTKSTSVSSLLTNFATIENTSSSLPPSLDNREASSSCATSHAPASHRPFVLSMPLGHLIRGTSRCGSGVSGVGTGDVEDGGVNSIGSDSSLSQRDLSLSPSSFLRHPLAHLLGEPLI